MRRRALLSATTGALLAGCAGRSPDTNETTPLDHSRTTDPGSPTSDGTGESTQGRGPPAEPPEIVSVDDESLSSVGLAIDLSVDRRATPYRPATVRATLRNESDRTLDVAMDAVAPLGLAMHSTDEDLFLAPQRLDNADRTSGPVDCGFALPDRENPCWQSQAVIATMDRLTGCVLYPGEAISNLHHVLVDPGRYSCPSRGEFEFRTDRLRYTTDPDERGELLSWGFTLFYPGPDDPPGRAPASWDP